MRIQTQNQLMTRLYQLLIPVLLLGNGALGQVDSSKFILYNDTARFNTIEDVLALPHFQDKLVYVDLWGTRCGPCIQEFPNMAALKQRYHDKPVVFLYLKSPYGFDDSKEWKEMIYRYNLEGIHVAMSIRFYSDNFWQRYKEKYTEERSYGIPTYMIIDRKGKIIDFDAPRPGKGQKLFEVLDAAL